MSTHELTLWSADGPEARAIDLGELRHKIAALDVALDAWRALDRYVGCGTHVNAGPDRIRLTIHDLGLVRALGGQPEGDWYAEGRQRDVVARLGPIDVIAYETQPRPIEVTP